MKKIVGLLWISLALQSTAVAIPCSDKLFLPIVPGISRSKVIMQAILNDPRLEQSLSSSDYIEEIRTIENETTYAVYTNNLVLIVHVLNESDPRKCGASRFRLEFDQPMPYVTAN